MSALWHGQLHCYKERMPTKWTLSTPSPLLSGVKRYFKILFFHTYRISPSVESVISKTLVSDSDSHVQCSKHTLMHTNIGSVFLDTCGVGNLGVKLKTISCMYVYMRVLIFIHWLYMYLSIYCYFYYHHYIIMYKDVDVFMKWMISLIQIFTFCCTL